jgi:hypothetical protein
LRLEEAVKKDVSEMQSKLPGAMSMMKNDDEVVAADYTFMEGDAMRNGTPFLSAIKHEGFDRNELDMPDLRNQADLQGNFLNDISGNFGLTSPITPAKPDQMRNYNAFQHNVNLSVELRKLVEEQL